MEIRQGDLRSYEVVERSKKEELFRKLRDVWVRERRAWEEDDDPGTRRPRPPDVEVLARTASRARAREWAADLKAREDRRREEADRRAQRRAAALR